MSDAKVPDAYVMLSGTASTLVSFLWLLAFVSQQTEVQ